MNILKYYKDHSSLAFEELLELSKLSDEQLLSHLDELIANRRLTKTKDNNYVLYKNLAVGRIDVKDNFSFLIQVGDDLFMQDKDIKDALDNDIVLVHIGKTNKVLEVLERNVQRLVVHVSKLGQKNVFIPIKPFRLTIELTEG
ncbi:MAG: hypothetical protein WCZ13_04755, partial [Acholeplasmataceae bacterium]